MKKLNIAQVQPLIRMAVEEDLGQGDTTSELFFKDDTIAKANIVSREEIVVCGMDVVGVHQESNSGESSFQGDRNRRLRDSSQHSTQRL